MKIIVGLGNPGAEYAATRHNVGFMAVDAISNKLGLSFSKEKHFAQIAEGRYGGEKIMLLKPLTFMNNSGEAVAHAVNFYNLTWDDVLVIFDDMDLACGLLRVRKKGSAGGHRGMGSIIQHSKTQEIARFKIGISHPVFGTVVDYVLQNFSAQELELIQPALNLGVDAALCWLEQDITSTMNLFNGKSKKAQEQPLD